MAARYAEHYARLEHCASQQRDCCGDRCSLAPATDADRTLVEQLLSRSPTHDNNDHLAVREIATESGARQRGRRPAATDPIIEDSNPRSPRAAGLVVGLRGLPDGTPTPLVQKKTLHFETFDDQFRHPSLRFTARPPKRLIWCYINVATPVADLDRPTATRAQLSPASISASAVHLRTWTKWLADRDILRFSDVTNSDFDAYTDHLRAMGVDRSVIGYRLFAVTRAWLYAPYLPPDDRLIRPTMGTRARRTFRCPGPRQLVQREQDDPDPSPDDVGAAHLGSAIRGELQRRHPRCTDDESHSRRAQRGAGSPIPAETVYRISPPPTGSNRNRTWDCGEAKSGTRGFAKQFMAWELGITVEQLSRISLPSLTRELTLSDEPLLPLPITGTVDGQTKWIHGIDFYRVETLCRHLATAALIVTGYLTGMRGEECRALEKGCCTPAKPHQDNSIT